MKNEKNRSGQVKTLALVLALVLALGAVGFSALAEDPATVIRESTRTANKLEIEAVEPGELLSAAQIYAMSVGSTVRIKTQMQVNERGYSGTATGAGSGFIVSSDGFIVTNEHVVDDATSIQVVLFDDTEYDAALVGSDENNDIAVLKIDAKDLTPVVLGSSEAINVGEGVLAIGNPVVGSPSIELTNTLTTGVISAKNREIPLSDSNYSTKMALLQTDCAINSGNSGGALFNMYGEVIGITNSKYTASSSGVSVDNIGFAVPIDTVKPIIKSIILNGYYSKPYIGVTVSDVSEELQSYGMPKGAAIQELVEDGPAMKAGLKEKDIITAVNGTEIDGSTALTRYLTACTVGDKLTFSVYRMGDKVELELTVGEKPIPKAEEQPAGAESNQQNDQGRNYRNDYGYDYGYNPFGDFFGGYSWPFGFGF